MPGNAPCGLSVVVPCLNASASLGALLDGLHRQTLPRESYEILVVDDGSEDGSSRIVAGFGDVRLLSQGRRGPGAARNMGTQAARGELILYLDADVRVSPDLLETHLAYHGRNPDVAATGGSVLPVGKYRLLSWSMADHLCSWFNAHPGVCYRRPPEYLPSLNFCVKREVVFGRCGIVWPDGPGRTGEDVLFCQALARHGLKLSFLPGATVFHRDRDTLSGFLRHMFRWGQHAPAVRGAALGLKYGFLFPRSRWKLAFTIPLIVSGYSTLVYLAWVRHRPLAATVAIPQILLGRLAYAAGVWSATGRRAAATAATS